jgi:hypothetical protein
MKTYEEILAEFEMGKEYSRADVEALLKILLSYHNTMANLIEYAERMFIMSGEACGFDAGDLRK